MKLKLKYVITVLSMAIGVAYGVPALYKDFREIRIEEGSEAGIRPPLESEIFTQPCQCYCSDLCGPRDIKPSDNPMIDEETGLCFCKQRDKDNYLKNDCDKKPQEDFANNCCLEQEKQEKGVLNY